MSTRFPALFVSHGAPSMIIEECPARVFLKGLGQDIGRPKGVVCISAHWTTAEPLVTMNPRPATIYDFGGFPDELYQLKYPAPGDPVLAKRVLSLLNAQGIAGEMDVSRGFDHGAWAPLVLMYPEADIPVIQLSVQPHMKPEHHLAVGRALQALRDEEILVLGSGSATHNLRDFFGRGLNSAPLPYAYDFTEWLKDMVLSCQTDDLLDYLRSGPQALKNHPTPEHFLPIFVALGTGGAGRVLHDSYTYGAISMASFSWQ